MNLNAVLQRTQRALRDDLRVHAVAVLSLVVAFLCLGTALLSVENLSRIAERWSRSQHLTIYLRPDAQDQDIAQLRLMLDSQHEVAKIEHVSAEHARELFSQHADIKQNLASLPSDVFPASLEVALEAGVDARQSGRLAERVSHFKGVDEIETYGSFLGQFHGLLEAGWSGAVLLSVLVLVCVLAVIANTIRVAVGNRKREIEVLKLCGATDGFVRGPFLVEGVLQAVTSASVAMLLLLLGYLVLRGRVETTLSELTGVTSVFLSPLTVCGLIAISGIIGGVGSAWSLRRHLRV